MYEVKLNDDDGDILLHRCLLIFPLKKKHL
jgi:hypothetical protein